MSDAAVRFETIDLEIAGAGDKPAYAIFRCPRGNACAILLAEGPHTAAHGIKRDGQNRNGGRAQWDFDGDRAAPTFAPSIDCKGCWHGYIERGRCVNTNHRDEPEPASRRPSRGDVPAGWVWGGSDQGKGDRE